ncbi:MAG: anti-sigma factor, partial [Thermomicrobiaceae bacterium]|nr:anti-sigma factor [Thermomicrobiaceae bacterium]
LRPPASAAGPAGASAGLDWYYLTGTSLAAGAHGILCRQDDGDLAWLIVEGLPAPPPGRVYQLWLIRQDGRLSGGTFTVDARGRAFMTIWLPAGTSPFQALGVTDEPPGGSPQPTGRRYLAGGV